MRVILVGNRMLAKHVLHHMLETDWDVVGVVAAGGAAARRQAGHATFYDLVESKELELIETEDINRDEVVERLSALGPDLCICPGWHQIIDERVLEIPAEGFLGFHASHLPKGRGGAPVNWALIHGEPTCGLSMFYYTPGVDAGDIVAQTSVPIQRRDDVDTVLDRLAHGAVDLLDREREALEHGTVEATPQPLSEATYRPRRQPQDGLIDWSLGPTDQLDWIRAQTHPYPGAYTFHEGRRVRVWEASSTDAVDGGRPGEIVNVDRGSGLVVTTGDGVVQLERLQVDDDPPLWADDARDRYGLDTGERLGVHDAPEDWLYTGIRDGYGGTEYETNLDVGQRGELRAVVGGGGTATVEVVTTLDDEQIHVEELSIEAGRTETTVAYAPADPGTKTLSVNFHRRGERIDVRYLKLFVPG